MSSNNIKKSSRLIIFIKNLKDVYNMSHDYFKDYYFYSGGNGYYSEGASEAYKEKKNKERLYAYECGITDEWMIKNRSYLCLCCKDIKNNIYFKHKTTEHIIIIGNRCCERYMNKKKKCSTCDNTHKNRKDNFCNNCRKIMLEQKKINKRVKEKINELLKKDKSNEALKLDEYIYINIDDMKINNYYVYTRGSNTQRKRVFFKLVEIHKNKIVCQKYKSDLTWELQRPLNENYNFIFYEKK